MLAGMLGSVGLANLHCLCYQATIDFCHKWDQTSFDPDYDTMPLEHFEPMVRRIFAREPFQYDRK